MADPGMMSLFGEDGNIFSEGLEGLGECGYPENPVNPMGQQMPIDQGFASLQPSLHHPSTNQNQTKLTHFDHYNQYEQQKMHLMDQPNRMMSNAPGNGLASPHSQYHTPPVPQVPHGGGGGGQMGVYPGMQNERHGQSFVDSGSMWGPRAVQVPDQIRAPYQQQQPPQQPQPAPSGPPAQGHPQHMPQMGSYMARGDFSMQQHGQPQQRMSQFSQGQEGLNQGNPFIATSGPGHLSHVPQQSPSMAPSLRHSVQQFHHHPPTALHGESVAHSPRFSPNPPQQGAVRPQTLNFSSRSQTVPSPTINNSGQYSRYPYSNLNQGLVNNTGMNQNLGLTNNTPMNQSVPRYPSAVGFPSSSGQGLMHQQPVHPSGSLNQMNTQTMHPSQPQGTYASPPPMSPMKAMSNPAGTPPPQVRPGSAGIPMEVGSYPNMPHPQPSHQPPGAMGIGQRNMGPRNMQQSRPFMGMSSAPRELAGHMRPNGCPGVGLADPQAVQERLLPGQQHPGQQPSFQQLPTCPPMQPHPGLHHQSSPPHPHHQPWAQLHPSPQSTPQKVPVPQHSPSEPFLEKPVPDMTQVSGPNAQLVKSDDYLPSVEQQPQQKKKKKKNNHIVAEDPSKSFGKDDFPDGVDNQELNRNSLDGSQEEKKKKKRPKAKKDPKEPKEPKEKKEPKEPKTPKAPKIPKEPKEKKAKTATPKPKSSKKSSNKKPDSEASALKKKVNKGKTEGSENSDLDRTPPPSPLPEEDEDPGVQKRRSSRQVKRKRYTEDLEFKISDEEADDADAAGRDSPSNTSQSEQQESVDAEGPVVEKIMSSRSVKKQKESGEEVEVEEFYVKYKNFSYLHCQWASVEDLEKDKRIQQKIKRFKAKQGQNKFLSEIEDELFNPDYVEVDRIMDFARSTDDRGEPVTHYLVKWCSLPYEDSTWELRQDIDQAKIEEFEKLMSREPETERVERPPADDWKKSERSREYKNNNKLREYQLEGVNWLLFNWYNMRNCILADEMGLGKTIQSITFLYEIYLKGIHGPFLVIAPLSTIPNWEREFRTWTELNVVVYHGSQASRRTIQLYEMYFKDPQGRVIKGSYKFHAIITTFEMILTDCPELRSIPWRCVVIDEAHRLKNRNCKLLEGLKMMDLEHKVLLTGTPLQNTVEELFSLLHFLEPSRFPSETTFMQEFGDLKTEEQVQKLQAILKPMMLRRLKEDVEKNLAPKEETIIEVELTNIQKKYYRAILEKNFTFLSKGGGQANVPNLLNTMMELRKCCNHPYLINGAEEKILEEFKETHNADSPDFQLQAMIQAAGKLVLIDKLLPKLKAGGHRVLIFSQMVRCLDILEDYLIQRRYPYERIDGRVRGNLRQAAIDRFSKPDSDRFVFLLCTRAGGLGINLTAADTCIIFDSDWNPQNDLQAQARCHRIGQSKSVKIYRLITRNSYEREMFDKASLKLGLDKAVLQSMSGRENATNGVQQLSKKEIEDLLRKGAYGALMDEEDEGSKFCEEDIDQILLRRTHTITIESEGKGSTFAKASFVASGNRTDISLDDPNFWQKWAKKAELDIDALNGRNNLVIDTPRVRKQTRLYSAVKEDELMEFSDLESDSEEKPCMKPRRPQDRSQGYARSECFRVEKNLLVYGWGRWTDILSHGRYKRQLTEQDVETICRTILVYCLNHYKGDENIKSFIWDLITPTADGQTRALVNHSGLSAPVPRGRKGKKVKAQSAHPVVQDADWLAGCNPDALFQEDSYKKHLKHHCNKVLLRVRMLYYLRQEVIGDQADKILEGADSSEADVWIPEPFHAEVPADWWDKEADKSLLIGVFKHGYEKYNSMRADPALCFLERVGMPDAKAIAAEQRGTDMLADGGDGGEFDREDEDPEYKPTRTPFKDEIDEFANSPPEDKEESMEIRATGKHSESNAELGQLYWPNTSTLTTRLRRLITAYQRSYKRQQMRQEALTKTDRRRRRPREEVRALEAEREAIISEKRQKWTRREEADFYRVVSTFGVIFDPMKQQFDWNQFRAFARLDKKSDESLEKYFSCFVAMCRRVCRMPTKPDDEPPDLSSMIEPITEERASRTLYRIELLRKIREQVLHHPQLGERLKLCQPSLDLPEWWECGRHDRDLLVGAAKHGVSRTDYHILNDPELSFLDAHKNFAQNRGAGNISSLNPLAVGFGQIPAVVSSAHVQDEKVVGQTEGKVEESENAAAREKPVGKEEEEETDGGEKDSKQECEAEASSVRNDLKGVEAAADPGPKSISEKGSEEDEEEKLEDDDKSEESSQPEAGAVSRGKNFDEESNASMSTARDETRDGFYMEDGDPSVAQLLHERTFTFSFWPKDRVMINRLDNICEAVLKGKWPVNRRQMFDFQGLIPGYTPPTVDSPLQKRSFAELSMVGQASISGSEDLTTSPQLSKEDALNLSVPRQRRRRRRKIEIEAERAAKRRNLMEMVAQLRESQVVSENGQEKVVDLSKASREATSSTSNFSSLTSKFILPNVSTPVSDAFKTQMELLQAGLSRTPTRHLLNGSLVDGEPPMKRRRGRRKNVEGLDLLFMSHKRTSLSAEDAEVTKAFEEDIETPPTRNIPSPGQLDPDTRIPVINLEDGTRLVGEDAPKNKDLVEWLKLHPTYTVDMPSYVPKNADVLFSSFQKPKQKRHRCRNPNKLDINTLTGEERVPVVNKRNGKKMGGAMAPPMKDLPRWLEENPEFAVAPDWTDIVKQSGFVPESMFDRLLTGPVVRGEGASRRGRRPKSEIARAAAAAAAAVASTSGINPLLVNSLFAGMDLTSLQNLQNLQSLQLAGLMGFPPGLATAAAAGGDAKNPAAVLPLMLPGMAGLPNMFGLGGLLNNPLSAATGNTTTASSQGEPEDGTSKVEEKGNENEEENKDSEKSTDAVSATDSANGSVGAATAPAGLPSNPLAFSPFLLSTMAPGLFYPSMFLPPGLGGLTLPGFPALAGLQNAVGSGEEKAPDKAEGGTFQEEENLEGSDAEENLDKTAESSILEDEIAQGEELDSLDGGDEIENNENDE
ncbi:chromodomain-helicase-DNA-binding protein 7 isoform X1 [Diceros bicornis minor]|uniref:chromodomain-helicase-DNA-binding protein 7 isoform X1 n=1 Tax=Diceros bicornis minor TaxID=77932 RepID=UPI0026EFBF5F|nr:chromodomain-helicase-DNA-binding protein 7 isoform X1 [Diceros bicornis minor]XP_058384740.1 chromodomain-helicase-DNA-binding protein 7 isoform X1 [Diceros bicornis minor]XP_058384741.1 chromodomain-helicase-DNA-binding protein 7 isoform X1 [Diceros bicornis minor]XP_058384742.1 chromodomain-helicase-DNA-binding protein 7 isoform X1 [Diceros bicornis minor]XP_058384743.1 chromodomain-helicase-DNA-binding protein 7 isoform X1 [Diceros bicornis minor]